MGSRLTGWIFIAFLCGSLSAAQCANDQRTEKKGGILIEDYTITGTQNISATEMGSITSDLIGGCFNDDSEEIAERVRASFQDRGYFGAEVKHVNFKPRDPLGSPKPVTLEADVSDGVRYRLAEISFVQNHAFPTEKLREQFSLKQGDVFERAKVASGIDGLMKLYGGAGYLDVTGFPETKFASNATVNLVMTMEEGPQYHMGKLEVAGDKELAAKVRAAWTLEEGQVYDAGYVNHFLDDNRELLPVDFRLNNVRTTKNCPEATVKVTLMADASQDAPGEEKSVPCEKKEKGKKDQSN